MSRKPIRLEKVLDACIVAVACLMLVCLAFILSFTLLNKPIHHDSGHFDMVNDKPVAVQPDRGIHGAGHDDDKN